MDGQMDEEVDRPLEGHKNGKTERQAVGPKSTQTIGQIDV
jgi:hypothetical protein